MTTVFGIDFSGGRDAGRKIWVAQGVTTNAGVRVETVTQGLALPGSGSDRARCLAAVRDLIRAHPDAAFGIDAPFGLHESLVPDASWEAFVVAFGDRYGDAEHFRALCREATGGKEPKRRTDAEAKVPFSTHNLRLFRQTYHAIADLLAPLVAEDAVRVRPMQAAAPGKATLFEICPASTLKAAGLYGSYKGKRPERVATRRALVADLAPQLGLTLADPALESVLIDDAEGDAIDAALSALATAKALGTDDRPLGAYRLEGYVYV